MRRVAIFYQSNKLRHPRSSQIYVGEGVETFIRSELTPRGTSLSDALGMTEPRRGENVMNVHYVT